MYLSYDRSTYVSPDTSLDAGHWAIFLQQRAQYGIMTG